MKQKIESVAKLNKNYEKLTYMIMTRSIDRFLHKI